MQVQELTRDRLRQLAQFRADGCRVLSIYLNLDPSEFATPAARATAMTSAADEAERQARDADGELSHDARIALRNDVERVREFFDGADLRGAHGLGVFVCGPEDLFETVRLPRPVPTEVVIDGSPFIEPLADMAAGRNWCLLLANRREARIFRGSRERLEEVARVHDDVHGQHDQGGWSQARYQRSVDNEATHHLKRSADAVLGRFRRARFDNLLLGAPEEAYAKLESELHPYLRERLRGRVEVDVENTTAEQVLEAARPVIERYERQRQDELLERLQEGVGAGGRGAGGLDGVLGALNERRVEALLLDSTFSAPGVECVRCGWVGSDADLSECPADGGELERRDDIAEQAIERALMQDAEVVVLRDRPELGVYGGIGAVLRF